MVRLSARRMAVAGALGQTLFTRIEVTRIAFIDLRRAVKFIE